NTFVGTITVVSGSFQTTTVGAAFGQPLKVQVRNSEGGPAPGGIPVIFTAPASGAGGKFGGSGTNSATGFTDPSGLPTPSLAPPQARPLPLLPPRTRPPGPSLPPPPRRMPAGRPTSA